MKFMRISCYSYNIRGLKQDHFIIWLYNFNILQYYLFIYV